MTPFVDTGVSVYPDLNARAFARCTVTNEADRTRTCARARPPLITHVRHVTRSNYTGGRAHAWNSQSEGVVMVGRGGGDPIRIPDCSEWRARSQISF